MAYTEDKAFELIESAYERGRLGHAFIISGTKHAGVESLTTRVINLINRDEEKEEEGGGADMFDLFGEVAGVDKAPEPEAENLQELEGELVRIVRPQMKSRIIPVDAMRELEKSMFKTARKGKYKVGVIVDADRMRTEAANAFLKTLEEPPNGSILFLLTASPERLLSTILSRCVNIPLIAENDVREELEGEQEMLTTLLRNAKAGFNSVSRALTIKSVFATILNKRKLAIGKVYEASLKEEQEHYKNTTDGEWLKDREKHYESLIQSDYLFERSKFIDLLILWLGDLVRIKSGAPRLDFHQYEVGMAEAASKESLESLIQRMDAMEELRGLFETNVSEALALEVCFMKAFA
ncbi:MAG: hypothetical protein ACSHX6_04890 [Akkermansiaceae bacterium]